MARTKQTINGVLVQPEETKTNAKTGKKESAPAKPKAKPTAKNSNKTAGAEQLYDERDKTVLRVFD